jgi:hypothetical protein
MLEEFYRTGTFPHMKLNPSASPPAPITHRPLFYLAVHIFFLAANLAVFFCFSRLYLAVSQRIFR